jgi:regulatory protein
MREEDDDRAGRPARRGRVVTSEAALLELGYAYVSRFNVTRARCRTHLGDKMRAAVEVGAVPAEEARRWVDAVVARLETVGALDDARYAEGRALTLHRRGRATRVIARDLAQRGIGAEEAERATEALSEVGAEGVDPDFIAAVMLARKRRLGPFGDPARSRERRQKDLAVLGRAGFSFAMARRVIEAPEADALLAECGLGG